MPGALAQQVLQVTKKRMAVIFSGLLTAGLMFRANQNLFRGCTATVEFGNLQV